MEMAGAKALTSARCADDNVRKVALLSMAAATHWPDSRKLSLNTSQQLGTTSDLLSRHKETLVHVDFKHLTDSVWI